MPALNTAQLKALATDLSKFAASIGDYLNAHGGISDDDYKTLNDASVQIAKISENLAITAADLDFADSQDAFTKLSSVTADARIAADELKAEVLALSKGLKVAAGVLALGLSFASGPGAVLTAAGNLRDALSA